MDFIDALKSIDRLKSFDWNDLFINTDVLNTKISDIKISPERQHSFSIMVKEISNAVAVFQQIDLQKIGEAFINLPDKVKKSAETWAKYGWVPYLPNTPAFLDCLFHGINIMRTWFCCTVRQAFFFAEHLKSFILRCGGKCKIARILQHFAPFNEIIDLIFKLVIFLGNIA